MPRAGVAIVGRPNVGKSTLFNRIVGRRISIEDPTSGVTRDRVLHSVTASNRTFDLIDTGGIGMVDRLDLSADVDKQIAIAIEEADVLIFLVDCRDGVAPLDETVANRLRSVDKPVILAANKADTDTIEVEAHAFHRLGMGEVLPVSAHQGRGLKELLAKVVKLLPPEEPEPEYEGEVLKIAFVGKRNTGKSSIINRLSGAPRVIVSDKPGTTRDSVDVLFERDRTRFVAIDTAGLRRRGKMDDSIEFYGQVRSERAVRRAEVVIFMIDASVPISKVDKRIGRLIIDECKPCVIAINKWDLAREAKPEITPESYHEYLVKELPALYFAPIAATSALTGENVWGLIKVAQDLYAQASMKVSTGRLNNALQEAYNKRRPKAIKNRMFKLYYGTQVDTNPPSFVIFCNEPKLVTEQYTRYLTGQLRTRLGFEEIPLQINYRSSHDRKK